MRRIFAIVTALLIAISGFSALPAQAAAVDGVYNCTVSGTFTVTNAQVRFGGLGNGYCEGHATIPDGVTSIGQDAFYQSRLSSVTMPNTVTSIAQSAFRYITTMTSVTIPSSVQSIGFLAFGTTPLTSVNFDAPSSLTTIAAYAFQNSRFTSITLPATVTSMGTGVFQLNPNLANINFQGAIPSGSPWEAPVSVTVTSTGCTTGSFSVVGTVLTNGSTCTGTANVPFGVTSIGANAFLGATSLATVNLPTSLTTIGASAFENATSLSSISFPSSLTTIGSRAFRANTSLTAITLPSSVTSIGTLAFFNTGLVSLVIPSSVTTIANNAFQQSLELTSLTLPSTLTAIGGGAFYDAKKLISVTIPSGVTSIGEYAFGYNITLTSVTFLGNAPATVDDLAFSNSPAGAKAYVGQTATGFGASGSTWKRLTVEQTTNGTYSCTTGLASSATPNFTLTNGVVSAGQACVGAVVIPTVATSIGSNAFNQATSVTSIQIPHTVNSISSGAFVGTSSLDTFTVDANNSNYSSIAGVLFNKTATSLIKYPAGKTATAYTVGSLISAISSDAFDGPSGLATLNFEANAPATVGVNAFSGLAAGARAVIESSATGFGSIGNTWNGLTVASNATPPTQTYTPSPVAAPAPVRPLPKIATVQLAPGKSAKSSTVTLQLSGVEQGPSGQDIQIKIFDVKGNLFRTLTVPITGTEGSLELAIPMALGEFTAEANTVNSAGGMTDSISHSSPIVKKKFYATATTYSSPTLFGEAFSGPIGFPANSAMLSIKAKKALVSLSAELKKTRSSLAITGFSARSSASRNFELALAQARARAVATFLKDQGLSNILYFSGYGAINSYQNLGAARKVELRLIK